LSKPDYVRSRTPAMTNARPSIGVAIFFVLGLGTFGAAGAEREELLFKKKLSPQQARCLGALLDTAWKYSPEDHAEMKQIAQVATARLDGHGRKHYVYLFEGSGWCGSAGCSMMIGEVEGDGGCR